MEASSPNAFERLKPEEQEKIYEFMGVTGCEDLDISREYLQATAFDMNKAVALYFEKGKQRLPPGYSAQPRPNPAPANQNSSPRRAADPNNAPIGYNPADYAGSPPIFAHQGPSLSMSMNPMYEQYQQYYTRKLIEADNFNPISDMFSSMGKGIKNLFKTDPGDSFNSAITKKLKIKKSPINFLKKNLKKNLESAQQQRRPLLVIIAPANLDEDTYMRRSLYSLLTHPGITDYLSKRYVVAGYLLPNLGDAGITGSWTPQELPILQVYRRNICEAPVLVGTVLLPKPIEMEEEAQQILQQLEQNGIIYKNDTDQEEMIRIEVTRSYMMAQQLAMMPMFMGGFGDTGFYPGGDMGAGSPPRRELSPEEEVKMMEDREIRQQQEENYQATLAQARVAEESKRMEDERRKKEFEEMEYLKRMKEEQKTRKRNSLGPEPDESPNAITIVFRFPGGERLSRRFLRSDKVDTVYTYAELTKEGESINDLEILQAHPFKALTDKNELLSQLFDADSQQETLQVRERS